MTRNTKKEGKRQATDSNSAESSKSRTPNSHSTDDNRQSIDDEDCSHNKTSNTHSTDDNRQSVDDAESSQHRTPNKQSTDYNRRSMDDARYKQEAQFIGQTEIEDRGVEYEMLSDTERVERIGREVWELDRRLRIPWSERVQEIWSQILVLLGHAVQDADQMVALLDEGSGEHVQSVQDAAEMVALRDDGSSEEVQSRNSAATELSPQYRFWIFVAIFLPFLFPFPIL